MAASLPDNDFHFWIVLREGKESPSISFPQSNAYHPPSLKLETEEIKSQVLLNGTLKHSILLAVCIEQSLSLGFCSWLLHQQCGGRIKAPCWRMLKAPRRSKAFTVAMRLGGQPLSALLSFSILPLAGQLRSLDFLKSPLVVCLTEWIRLWPEHCTAAQSNGGRPRSCHLYEWI